jgi:hypothetical protein
MIITGSHPDTLFFIHKAHTTTTTTTPTNTTTAIVI